MAINFSTSLLSELFGFGTTGIRHFHILRYCKFNGSSFVCICLIVGVYINKATSLFSSCFWSIRWPPIIEVFF